MAKSVTFHVMGEGGKHLDNSTLYSDGTSEPIWESWLSWEDYSKGEIDLSKLPKGARKIKVRLD